MKPNLRAVDNQVVHARDLARRKVSEWGSIAETEQLPVSNQHDSTAPSLRVDDVLRRSELDHRGKR